MTKPKIVTYINGSLSYEDAEAKRNKIMHKDLYGLYSIYVDDKTQLWVIMPLKILNAMMEFDESEEAKKLFLHLLRRFSVAQMNQSRTASLIESVFNVVIGYGVALASQLAIFPMFGIHLPLSDNLAIGAWFTVISLVRSYAIRRWFNARLHRAANKLAGL